MELSWGICVLITDQKRRRDIMKKALIFVTAVLCMISPLMMSGCGKQEKNEESIVQIANPFVEVKTLDEAIAGSGIDAVFPEELKSYEGKKISYVKGDFIQVIYGDEENNVYARKGKLTEDISGDYNVYKEIKEVMLSDIKATFKGENGMYYKVIWNTKTNSFSLSFSVPVDEETARDIMSQIR